MRFEVCDVSQHPERGDEDAVCYTPVLVKRRPLPRAHVLGDLSNPAALVVGPARGVWPESLPIDMMTKIIAAR